MFPGAPIRAPLLTGRTRTAAPGPVAVTARLDPNLALVKSFWGLQAPYTVQETVLMKLSAKIEVFFNVKVALPSEKASEPVPVRIPV